MKPNNPNINLNNVIIIIIIKLMLRVRVICFNWFSFVLLCFYSCITSQSENIKTKFVLLALIYISNTAVMIVYYLKYSVNKFYNNYNNYLKYYYIIIIGYLL